MRLDVCVALSLLAVAVIGAGTASAQISDDVVRIGVLNDQSNVYADLGGQGSVIAARMAIDDVGGKVLGKPIDILVADHQSKADVGASIARQWFDSDKVDLAIGFRQFLGCPRRRAGRVPEEPYRHCWRHWNDSIYRQGLHTQ